MRFLHTSDWHIGKPLRTHKRDDEYVAALDEVFEIARDREVDCVARRRGRLRLGRATARGRAHRLPLLRAS